MASIYNTSLAVDSTGHHIAYTGNSEPLLVRNIGLNTVYVGRVQLSGSDTVYQGYPIYPGESVSVPNALGTDTYCAGFNTDSGSSELRILGVN